MKCKFEQQCGIEKLINLKLKGWPLPYCPELFKYLQNLWNPFWAGFLEVISWNFVSVHTYIVVGFEGSK